MPIQNLSLDDFDALRRLIYEHSGIWLGAGKVSFLQTRLVQRLAAVSVTTAREYYRMLKYDPQGPAEMQQLVDAITVNETWFYRETEPLRAWVDGVMPTLLRLQGRVRVWSAACSTGEEPYTLAMLMLEVLKPGQFLNVEIIGTDISQRALAAARAGLYDPYSMRQTSVAWKERFFRPHPSGRMVVNEEPRRMVNLSYGNLMDKSLGKRIGPVDAVVCRNVIIYFDEQSRQTALSQLYSALKPGGYLMLGQSETLAHEITPFEVTRLNGTVMYKKGQNAR